MGDETEAGRVMQAALAAYKEQMDRIEPQWPELFGGPITTAMSDSAPNNVWYKGTGAGASADTKRGVNDMQWGSHIAITGTDAYGEPVRETHRVAHMVPGPLVQNVVNSEAAFLEWQDHLRRQDAATLPDAREMDLRNVRALLSQRDDEIEDLNAGLRHAMRTIARMSSENGALSDEVERLKRDLENLRPKPSREAPHNPWGRVHDGRAPDIGEPR
jgi:hypothetical protein